MTCAQGLLRLLWGGGRSWSATGLLTRNDVPLTLELMAVKLEDIF